ncbi:hypothetical protein J2X55_003136 [Microbacterium sp. 1154]|uniref:hypothetical protein n=1 Tax=Microbacterium sp. 1154 TaxID=2817733 RepID=UPI00285906A5|nr:hypothetical protein [Microbacterium sp. 1154]MDR6692194.1 hypothetical protein [Microbacterium sp. 1154]
MPSISDDDELAALRRRAYAPGADISSDPAALQRLIELESRSSDDVVPAPSEVEEDPVDPSGVDEPADAPRRRFRMPRLRRSMTILLTAAALVVACAATALVVVQRVQTDPLQAGATQIARVSPDSAFVVPSVLFRGVTSGVTAYAEWQGFRFITYPSVIGGDDTARCLTVWQPDLLDASSNGSSYDGEIFTQACGAGPFPANVVALLRETTPERSRTEFPPDTALQFVYDAANDEVVVFQG